MTGVRVGCVLPRHLILGAGQLLATVTAGDDLRQWHRTGSHRGVTVDPVGALVCTPSVTALAGHHRSTFRIGHGADAAAVCSHWAASLRTCPGVVPYSSHHAFTGTSTVIVTRTVSVSMS